MKKLGALALTVIASVATYEFLKRRGYLDLLLGEEEFETEFWYDEPEYRVKEAIHTGKEKAKEYYEDAHDALDEFLEEFR